jgi:hypothetical protein
LILAAMVVVLVQVVVVLVQVVQVVWRGSVWSGRVRRRCWRRFVAD